MAGERGAAVAGGILPVQLARRIVVERGEPHETVSASAAICRQRRWNGERPRPAGFCAFEPCELNSGAHSASQFSASNRATRFRRQAPAGPGPRERSKRRLMECDFDGAIPIASRMLPHRLNRGTANTRLKMPVLGTPQRPIMFLGGADLGQGGRGRFGPGRTAACGLATNAIFAYASSFYVPLKPSVLPAKRPGASLFDGPL